MAKCYVKAFFDWIEQTTALEDDERGRLFIAILEYARSGVSSALTGREAILFPVFKAQIDRDLENSATYAENGRKGGKKKNISQAEAKLTEMNQIEPKRPNKDNNKDNDKDNDNDKNEELRAASPSARAKSDGFDQFWEVYPKKVGKSAAQKAFSKIEEPLDVLLPALEQQKFSDQWTRDGGRYIPNPATWLNQGRWQDEVSPPAAAKPGQNVQRHAAPLSDLERQAVARMLGKQLPT